MRREGDDLEAIEAELGAPSDAESGAGEPGDGPPASGPTMVRPPGSGPPEHWLAYIRARVPGLVEPGGPLAAAGTGPRPDIIPHGIGAGQPTSPSVDEVGGAGTRPRIASSEVEPDAPRGARPTPGLASSGPPGGDAANPSTPAPVVPPGPEEVANPGRAADAAAIAIEGVRDRDPISSRTKPDPAASRIPTDDGAKRPAPEDASWEPSAPSRSERDDALSAATAAPSPEASADGAAAALEPSRSPDPVASPQTDPWPGLAGSKRPERAAIDPFRTLGPLAPRRPLPPGTDPRHEERRPTASPVFTDGWPAAWPAAPRPADGFGPAPFPTDAWRVEAARPDVRAPVDLPLPAWPTLPDDPPDDRPDWPSLDRRLERATRLDLEQRRR